MKLIGLCPCSEVIISQKTSVITTWKGVSYLKVHHFPPEEGDAHEVAYGEHSCKIQYIFG